MFTAWLLWLLMAGQGQTQDVLVYCMHRSPEYARKMQLPENDCPSLGDGSTSLREEHRTQAEELRPPTRASNNRPKNGCEGSNRATKESYKNPQTNDQDPIKATRLRNGVARNYFQAEPLDGIISGDLAQADSGNPPQRVEQQVRFGVGCKDGAPCDMQPPTAVVSEPIPGPTERISDNLTRQTRTCKIKTDFLLQDSGGKWKCLNLMEGNIVEHNWQGQSDQR